MGNLTIIGSDNDLLPGRRQAIIWINAGILLIAPLLTNFSEIWIEIHTFSFKKMYLKISSANWHLFHLGLNVLTLRWLTLIYGTHGQLTSGNACHFRVYNRWLFWSTVMNSKVAMQLGWNFDGKCIACHFSGWTRWMHNNSYKGW